VLRTWRDPRLVGPDRTYVGMDDTLTVRHVGFTLGVYVRVPDQDVGPGLLISAGVAAAL